MIHSLKPEIKAVIMDMDGVLWRDDNPIGDLPAIFTNLQSRNIAYLFVTNNSTKSIGQYENKFAQFGVKIDEKQIISSSLATRNYLEKHYPQGSSIYIVGEQGLFDTMSEAGFHHSDRNVQAVIVGLNRELTYNELRQAAVLIQKGAAFIGTNPDTTFPTPEGMIPGTGASLAALEATTGVHPIVIGKPNVSMFELALERLQLQPKQVIMIGDRLDTDILGGQNAGMRTGLVLSGISSQQEAEVWHPAPDLVANDLETMIGLK